MSYPQYKQLRKQSKKELKNYKRGELFFESLKLQPVFSNDGGKEIIMIPKTYHKNDETTSKK